MIYDKAEATDGPFIELSEKGIVTAGQAPLGLDPTFSALFY